MTDLNNSTTVSDYCDYDRVELTVGCAVSEQRHQQWHIVYIVYVRTNVLDTLWQSSLHAVTNNISSSQMVIIIIIIISNIITINTLLILHFLPKLYNCIAEFGYCHDVSSVYLSVMRVYCDKTTDHGGFTEK